MSSNSDANDILNEILEDSKKPESEPQSAPEPEPQSAPESEPQSAPESEPQSAPEPEPRKKPFNPEEKPTRNLILIGVKPLVTYVNSTLTQLSTLPTVTIKARGKRITQAVDVSQFILKRMHSIGYSISDVRISSDALESKDGKTRNVSTIEIDISHN
ncbi:MAG: DNA-binding protein [Candidatus Nitrosopelagicus sp.]|nr:DNA-binding protein [Candidatus Nitrosopelagicus sp.]